MSDGFSLDAIGDLLSAMSEEDLKGLSDLAGSIFSDEGSESKGSSQVPPHIPFPDFNGIDFETITRIMGIMKKLSSRPNDPGCELIAALKPLLSKKRQKKADEAISMLRVLSLLPIIGELK